MRLIETLGALVEAVELVAVVIEDRAALSRGAGVDLFADVGARDGHVVRLLVVAEFLVRATGASDSVATPAEGMKTLEGKQALLLRNEEEWKRLLDRSAEAELANSYGSDSDPAVGIESADAVFDSRDAAAGKVPADAVSKSEKVDDANVFDNDPGDVVAAATAANSAENFCERPHRVDRCRCCHKSSLSSSKSPFIADGPIVGPLRVVPEPLSLVAAVQPTCAPPPGSAL